MTMSLRGKLALAFALFAAVPMAAATVVLVRVLSASLGAEYAVRLDEAASAVEEEVRRLGTETAAAAHEVAGSAELEALARDRREGTLDDADAALRAGGWMAARGLDALAVVDPSGLVVSSGHLPGRAGDVDPAFRDLLSAAPAGRPDSRLLARAGPEGVEEALFLVAWEPAAADPSLRAVAGELLGAAFVERAAALTGGEVVVRLAAGREVARAGTAEGAPGVVARFLGAPRARSREVPVPSSGVPLALVEVALPAGGLRRALATVSAAFLAAIAAAVAAAAAVGHLVARRVTRPLEALREGAAAVAAGNLSVRVEVRAGGEVGELVGAFNAMTADLARVTARAAAAERVAAWREVARRLAHEVMNPLTPVAMSVETLRAAWARRSPQFPEIFEEATAAIGEEVRRLARIVEEFGRFARLPPPDRARLTGADLVSSLLALYPEGPPGIELRREVAERLPPVEVDRDQILQVLHNLLRNAFEACGRTGTVTISARDDAGELVIAVRDSGPGIRPEDRARLFEPYFTTKEAGTGLGLAISDRIVREHGGRIEVESEVGKGALFAVHLPAAS